MEEDLIFIDALCVVDYRRSLTSKMSMLWSSSNVSHPDRQLQRRLEEIGSLMTWDEYSVYVSSSHRQQHVRRKVFVVVDMKHSICFSPI